jgi:hypothetical protein
MAKKATAKSKAEKSYAKVAGGVKTPSVFAKTSCKLQIPSTYPSRRIPTTKEESSFFLDLKATDASDVEVAECLAKMENIVGVSYRDDLRVVEVICTGIAVRNDYAKKEIVINGKKSLFPMIPREQQPNILYVRMANLPYGDEEDIQKAIRKHWEGYGEVLDVAAHKVYNKWLTRRWDLLLVIDNGKKLEAPVAFDLLGRPVVAAWPSSPPSCLVCNSAGHQAKKCPQKNPKAGGRPDPEKKDRQEKSKKGKDTETVLEVLPKPKQAKIGEETVSATVSESASASISKSVTKSDDSEVEGPEMKESEMQTDEEESDSPVDYSHYYLSGTVPDSWTEAAWAKHVQSFTEEEWLKVSRTEEEFKEIMDAQKASVEKVNRMDTVTPPPFQFEDPTTPRKGNKRMVKDDNVVTAGNVEFVANVGGEGVRRSSRKRKPTKRK